MVMSGSKRSKEDDVQKIFTSVFVTNFPNGYGAKDLWNTCKIYGHVVDVFFPDRRTKAGNQVQNVGMEKCPNMVLDETCLNHEDFSLCLLGKVKEFASLTNLKVVLGKAGYANIELKYMGGFWVMIVFQDDETKKSRIASRWGTLLNGEELEEEGYHGEEGYDVNDGSHKDDMYVGVSENLKDVEGESDREEVPETNFEEVPNKSTFEGNSVRQTDVHSEDPFGDVPVKKVDNWSDENRVNDGQEIGVCVGQHVHERVEVSNDTHESTCSGHFKKSEVHRKGGSILELIDDLVNVGQTMGYDITGCIKNMEEIIESQGAELADLDGVIDKGEGSDADGHRRREVVRLIQEAEKNNDLEREVSNEEIKKAVWDCGIDKAPGSDSFTFGFYR
nr:nucleotide-binding alpha-beta plait domain-containing protein [Tanacetum cinerariifolium]